MGKVSTRILAAVAVLSLAANFWLFRSLQVERRQLDAALASLAIASSAPNTGQDTTPPKAAAESSVEERTPGNAAMKSGAPVQPPRAAKAVAPRIVRTVEECLRLRAEELRAEWRDNPRKRELARKQAISTLTNMNWDGNAQRELGVSAEQLNRLVEIQVDRSIYALESGQSTTSWSGSSETVAPDSAAYQGIASEFGDTMARKWAEYRLAENGRAWVRNTSLLANIDPPLSADQRQKLGAIYSDVAASLDRDFGKARQDTAAHARDVAEYMEQLEQKERREAERSRRLQQAFAGVLSAEQLPLFRQRAGRAVEVYRFQLQRVRIDPAEFEELHKRALQDLDSDGC